MVLYFPDQDTWGKNSVMTKKGEGYVVVVVADVVVGGEEREVEFEDFLGLGTISSSFMS